MTGHGDDRSGCHGVLMKKEERNKSLTEVSVLTVRKTFFEVVALSAAPARRSASCPPGNKEFNVGIGPEEVVMMAEGSTWVKPAAQHGRDMEESPDTLLVQNPDSGGRGVHPSDPVWKTTTKVIISNIPCRCRRNEFQMFLQSLFIPGSWCFHLPMKSAQKNRGYAVVEVGDPSSVLKLVDSLWQKRRMPSRTSDKPLYLRPAI
eukprot:gb/GFBE01004121.1/.p1 GENE.gb/GFBE01004121.1/~~gb/GFBE01004121.1/.p1  ORF type:complete len:204 (+),score=37.26 gb/GFBE01004121.1/:1-612(+)